ncbi:MAG: ribosome biogenesis GTPase Der, partial [Dehalococcoidia bacterium]|nr:ribosome biogenesis GTPase Der [Dehalococcoidia bacterium]
VDMVIKQAMEKQLPPRVGSRQLRVLRACQDKSVSSAFVLHVNDPHLVSLSYQRYLVNSLRREFGFCGSPLRLVLAKASGKRRRVGEEATRA